MANAFAQEQIRFSRTFNGNAVTGWHKVDTNEKLTAGEANELYKTIYNNLSPENLHCDGEITVTAARAKYKKLVTCGKLIEKLSGVKFDEANV